MKPGEDWRDYAECTQTDPDLFFPTDKDRYAAIKAKKICAICEVTLTCLVSTMNSESSGLRHGVAGGLTPRERAKLARLLKPESEDEEEEKVEEDE